MKALLIALVALLVFVSAQNLGPSWLEYTAWSANFICSAPQFGSGIFTGKITYDWSVQAFQIIFDGVEGYQEFYQFNPDRGYKINSPTGQFAFQYLYKKSKSCPCETTGLNFAMPPLFQFSVSTDPTVTSISGLTYWTNEATNDKTLSTGPATKYVANSGFTTTINGSPKSYILSSFYWLRDLIPAGFNINDFQRRTFALTNVVKAAPGSLALVAPKTGCKCGKQLDIALSLDRSGSISRDQWTLEYQFVQNLAKAFQYGPLLANMAIGNWNSKQWETLAITQGTTDAVVQAAAAGMTCCPGTSTTQCCCCGTPIGGGIWLGGQMLSVSPRGKAQKILILLTDGCQNHLFSPATGAVSCGCTSEKACALNATCVGDITTWYNWVERNIPGTRIIVVGVGTADTICKDQLLLAAGGDPTNVFNPQDWNQLQTLVESISATACTADNALCPGCCGICTCGQCIPPTACMDANNCSKGVLDAGGCCTYQEVVCPKQPCKYEVCEPSLGGCIYQDTRCAIEDDECIHYACNPTSNSVLCEATKKVDASGNPPPQCVTVVPCDCTSDIQCNDNNTCTTDTCTSCKCYNTDVKCQDSDECTLRTCKKDKGCVEIPRKPCNDYNNCTIDSCDPTYPGGCRYQNVTCPAPPNKCLVTVCDKINGCGYVPYDCGLEGYVSGNCTNPACNVTGCYNKYSCVAPPPSGSEGVPTTVILVSTLTTAAVAGIVIAAVLLAAGLGGGAVAAVLQVGAGGGAVVTASNPLYAGAGVGGDNPLNQG